MPSSLPGFQLDHRPRQTPQPRRRGLLKAASAAALLLAGAGCGAREPVRIGFLAGLSGRVSDLGIGGRNGTQLAIDDINAAGGIAGRLLELVSRDDEQNGELARQRLAELYALGVAFVVGPMTSQMAAAVLPMANERRIPFISPLAGANDFRGKDDAFFRVVSDSAASARQQAEALQADAALRRIPVVVVSADATQARMDALLRSGVQAYLTKPLLVADTLKIIDRLLAATAGRPRG